MKGVQLVAAAPDKLWEEISSSVEGDWMRVSGFEEMMKTTGADAFFYLYDDGTSLPSVTFPAPLFINAVPLSSKEIPVMGNVCRINGWPGFLQRNVWELSGQVSEKHKKILHTLNKEYVITSDEPGFISARVLAMIINEAYFALEEKVSTKKEMDTALRLGTNYPMGPFEWAEKIGVASVFKLLEALSFSDKRYLPAPLLKIEAGEPR